MLEAADVELVKGGKSFGELESAVVLPQFDRLVETGLCYRISRLDCVGDPLTLGFGQLCGDGDGSASDADKR